MSIEEKIRVAEAIIFASGDGISVEDLSKILDADSKQLNHILSAVKEKFSPLDCGIELNTNTQWVSFICAMDLSETVKEALSIKKNTPLSSAALETLAIIAYNQPITRSFIERVRGVDSSSSLSTLISRGLVEETGRLDIPGNPISYGTTPLFLRSFSLESLADLPVIKKEELGQLSTDDFTGTATKD